MTFAVSSPSTSTSFYPEAGPGSSKVKTKTKSQSSHSKYNRATDNNFIGPDLKLFVKDIADKQGRKRALTVKTWSTIKDVKDAVQKHLHVPPSAQRIYFGPLTTAGQDLPNHRTLNDAGIYRNGEVLFLDIKGSTGSSGSGSTATTAPSTNFTTLKSNANDVCVSKVFLDSTPKHLRRILQQARRAMALGYKPSLVLDGSGGTYFLHDARKRKIAVFKPADEEPYAENNPRGYVKAGGTAANADDSLSMRAGINPGEACLREVAAYLLDHKGFSGVPMTTLAEARHPAFNSNGSMLKVNQGGASVGTHSLQSLGASPLSLSSHQLKKVGSCQEFIPSECSMDDLSPSKICIDEVHRIAVLDIRIMNADRNTANLLCRRNPEDPDTFELIPIDHGYCLRTVADVCWFDWCWLDWPQLKQPISKKTKDYILSLDIEADVRMLKEQVQIPQAALDYFKASSKLLQEGVRAGMTLYDIAILCCRNDDAGELPSKLETIVSMAANIANSAVDNGRWHHAAASRALEQQLSPENGVLSQSHTFTKPRGMSIFKSASSVNFSSFRSETSSGSDAIPTPMAQSSGSDSSSDAEEEVEEEDCDKWAEELIAHKFDSAATSTPLSMSRFTGSRQRSLSFAQSDSSDDSSSSTTDNSDKLSSSPSGFWMVPPSASKSTPLFDDDDTTWSPVVSPSPAYDLVYSIDSLDLQQSTSTLPSGTKRIVKFDTSTLIPPKIGLDLTAFEQPKVNSNSTITNTTPTEDDIKTIPLAPIPKPNLMKRSLSYSAFSFKRIADDDSSDAMINPRASPSTIPTDQFQIYYQKFIDLLIIRETFSSTARNRRSKAAASGSSQLSFGDIQE